MQQDVILPVETKSSDRSVNVQEVELKNDKDSPRPNASEEVIATEPQAPEIHEEAAASTHPPVLSSSHQQVTTVRRVDQEGAFGMLPPFQLQGTHSGKSNDDHPCDDDNPVLEHASVC
jgi:hypothetical protein